MYIKTTHTSLEKERLYKMNDIKLNKDFWVTVHNDLVQARFSDSLSMREQKVLYAVLSNIEPPEFDINEKGERVIKNPIKDIPTFKVPIKDFTEWLGFKDPNYIGFKNAIKKLMKKLIEIQQPDGSWEIFQWVTKSSYLAKEGMAEIKLSPELYPYLLNLEKNFTTVRLNVLLSFKSVYSSRLYQLIKKWSKIGTWKVEVDELKSLLGVPVVKEVNGKKQFRLSQYGHFKQKALEVALAEVNEHSEFKVTMIEHKTVRKITSLTFEIKEKRKLKKVDEKPPADSQEQPENDSEGEGSERGIYAESFKKKYEARNRSYYDRKTGEMVYFDDEERVKAIILNNLFSGIGNDACFTIEKLLMKLINIPTFNISREVHELFNYTKHAATIKNPEAFIISKLKILVEKVVKGNTNISVQDILDFKGNKTRVENLPDWWFEGEKSKREKERKEQIAFELGRLGNYSLTYKDAEHFDLMVKWKKEEETSPNNKFLTGSKFEDYKKLKESGVLHDLVEKKKEELKALGYLDNNGQIKEEVINELYLNELKRSA